MSGNTFWNDAKLEPKRKFRWMLYFAGAPQFIIKSVTKPSFQVQSTNHQFLQHTFHFPGRVSWQDVNLTLVDPVNPDATQALYNILKNAGYQLPTEVVGTEAGYRTISKQKMVTSLGEFKIQQIDAEGNGANNVIETWVLNNPQITSVNFDGLDYSSDEALNIQIGVKYDWAVLNPDGDKDLSGWNLFTPQT
tara:strand:+ start:237 stop:812 length:576 start_codon:yes stop_codon:yes gene_type:complete